MKIGDLIVTTKQFRLSGKRQLPVGTKGKVARIQEDLDIAHISFKGEPKNYMMKSGDIRPATLVERLSSMIFP